MTAHPFPDSMPTIRITEIDRELGPIDCQHLQWWFAIPQLGDRTMHAAYDCDTGKLDFVRQVVSTAPATIDGQEAVELVIVE